MSRFPSPTTVRGPIVSSDSGDPGKRNGLAHFGPAHHHLLESLAAPFREAALATLRRAASEGALLVPFCGFRDPATQARWWRQSRCRVEIDERIALLLSHGAPRLANLLDAVGPQRGRPVTWRLPGQSPHQYGLALDCHLVTEAGEADWRETAAGYATFARAAEREGLTPGWHFGDPFHIEWRERPFDPLCPASMEAALLERGLLVDEPLGTLATRATRATMGQMAHVARMAHGGQMPENGEH